MKKLLSILFIFSAFGLFGQFDLAISPAGLTSPADGCYLSASETVTIIVANNQATPYSGTFDISYIVNAGTPVVETVTTAMPGNGTYIYSFTVDADLSACQIHTLDIAVYDVNDINNANDSISVNIISDCDPVVGTIGGPDTLCSGINYDSLQLWGYSGNILDWESSTDGVIWNSLSNTTEKEYLINLIPETYFRVIVGSLFGLCPQDTTLVDTISVFQLSDAGVLPADTDICDNGNGGIINLTGYTSTVVEWLTSSDNGVSWTSIANTTDTMAYSNLMDTTFFQAVVVNGSCPADTTATLTLTLIPGSFAGSIVGETLVCNYENDSSLYVTGYNGDSFAWFYSTDSGATWLPTTQFDTVFTYSQLQGNTLFSVEVTEGTCPPDVTTHWITVLPLNVTATADINPITEGDSTQLQATGGTTFLWFPDTFMNDPNGSSPTVWPEADMTYYVQITDINGCVDTASVTITVLPDITDLIVPNLITPNGDGFNDTWIIENIDTYPLNEVYIFNGYGQKIYEASPYYNDFSGDFNGGKVPDGTYYYIIRLNEPSAIEENIQGVITILGNE